MNGSHMCICIVNTEQQHTPACLLPAYLTLRALVLSAQIQMQIVGAGVSHSTKLFVCCCCCCCWSFLSSPFCSVFYKIHEYIQKREGKKSEKEKLKEHIEHDPYIYISTIRIYKMLLIDVAPTFFITAQFFDCIKVYYKMIFIRIEQHNKWKSQ